MATGTERTISTKLTYGQRPIWSPDGRSIFLGAKDEKGREGVYRVDAQTGDVTALVTGNDGGCAKYPVGFSSDGGSIICLQQDFAHMSFGIVKQDLKSGQTQDIFRSTSGNVYPVVVSNDGRQAAFGFWGDTGSLQVVSTAGGEPRVVYRFGYHESTQSLAWSADGRHLFFALIREDPGKAIGLPQRSLWRVPVTGGAPEETGISMDRLRQMGPHPDGQRITFTSGQRAVEVWVMENFLPKTDRPPRPKQR
jgi:Tol biopolymer transport system component